jgi:hypothetical protein
MIIIIHEQLQHKLNYLFISQFYFILFIICAKILIIIIIKKINIQLSSLTFKPTNP